MTICHALFDKKTTRPYKYISYTEANIYLHQLQSCMIICRNTVLSNQFSVSVTKNWLDEEDQQSEAPFWNNFNFFLEEFFRDCMMNFSLLRCLTTLDFFQ